MVKEGNALMNGLDMQVDRPSLSSWQLDTKESEPGRDSSRERERAPTWYSLLPLRRVATEIEVQEAEQELSRKKERSTFKVEIRLHSARKLGTGTT